MYFTPNSYGVELMEFNDCHEPAGQPSGGQFCGKGYRIHFRSEGGNRHMLYTGHIDRFLTEDETRKLRSARVRLTFDGSHTGYLGAPTKWTAPNGVVVVYVKAQRRSDAEGSVGVYHDFHPGDEAVIPLTRNIGAGRRALRAWAAVHVRNVVTERFRARQMVRPGD